VLFLELKPPDRTMKDVGWLLISVRSCSMQCTVHTTVMTVVGVCMSGESPAEHTCMMLVERPHTSRMARAYLRASNDSMTGFSRNT
jgi:hypothetical protein